MVSVGSVIVLFVVSGSFCVLISALYVLLGFRCGFTAVVREVLLLGLL